MSALALRWLPMSASSLRKTSRLAVSRLWLPQHDLVSRPWLTRCRVVMSSRLPRASAICSGPGGGSRTGTSLPAGRPATSSTASRVPSRVDNPPGRCCPPAQQCCPAGRRWCPVAGRRRRDPVVLAVSSCWSTVTGAAPSKEMAGGSKERGAVGDGTEATSERLLWTLKDTSRRAARL